MIRVNLLVIDDPGDEPLIVDVESEQQAAFEHWFNRPSFRPVRPPTTTTSPEPETP